MKKYLNLGFFTDDLFLEHNTGKGHFESPSRLISIREKLEKSACFSQWEHLSPRKATVEELELVHTADYLSFVKGAYESGQFFLDPDTVISRKSYEAAVLAAGAGLEAADKVLSGDIQNALLLLRPPGHHSLPEKAMGFCLFNNIALCARYLRKKKGVDRVAVLDWDVHHGNGTEAVFYEDPNVFFISLHQYPFYPGTGAAQDTGRGKGAGFTLNIPMARGSDDAQYRKAFQEKVIPALKNFEPQVILISAGFDAHYKDPLGGIELETKSFEWMTRMTADLSLGQQGTISFLEGGYDLQALAECVGVHAEVLAG